ncbi:uncharacterized protein LOC111405894 [Olea europaea var. sylvestris]|uniref:uncharacterized protein LOC111405894 n=1 Tax=Olea europaea var. sylvestris TaxID=158386 RepID=UPI000C1D6546|nr:uncharacterized protein LOC111405894 [Olea europaea var. sylvestris]
MFVLTFPCSFRVSHTIGNRTVSDPYKWFHDITISGAWLIDDHIDLAMDLLQDRAQRHPKSFDVHRRVILNTEFLRVVTIEYQSLQLMGNEYTVSEYMLEWVIGMSPSVGGKSWEDCTLMYIAACIDKHYVTLEIVFC